MTELNRLYATTSLSGPGPTKGLPSPEAIGPQALEAAKRIRRYMSLLGVASCDDLVVLAFAMLRTISERSDRDFADIARGLAPTMLDVFKGSGEGVRAPEAKEPWDPKQLLSSDDIGEIVSDLSRALSVEAAKMGFASDQWFEACAWIILAMLIGEFGFKSARKRFLFLLFI